MIISEEYFQNIFEKVQLESKKDVIDKLMEFQRLLCIKIPNLSLNLNVDPLALIEIAFRTKNHNFNRFSMLSKYKSNLTIKFINEYFSKYKLFKACLNQNYPEVNVRDILKLRYGNDIDILIESLLKSYSENMSFKHLSINILQPKFICAAFLCVIEDKKIKVDNIEITILSESPSDELQRTKNEFKNIPQQVKEPSSNIVQSHSNSKLNDIIKKSHSQVINPPVSDTNISSRESLKAKLLEFHEKQKEKNQNQNNFQKFNFVQSKENDPPLNPLSNEIQNPSPSFVTNGEENIAPIVSDKRKAYEIWKSQSLQNKKLKKEEISTKEN